MENANFLFPIILSLMVIVSTIYHTGTANYVYQRKLLEALEKVKNEEGNHIIPVKALTEELRSYRTQFIFTLLIPSSMVAVLLYMMFNN